MGLKKADQGERIYLRSPFDLNQQDEPKRVHFLI